MIIQDENGNPKDLSLFWCDCKHPIDDRNIRFKVKNVAMMENFETGYKEVVVGGTLCRFCSNCYTMQEIPNQVITLNTDDLSDALTRIILDREHKEK